MTPATAVQIKSTSFSANPKDLAAVLKAVRIFTSTDESRFVMTHVLAEVVPKGVKFTATDGHTLCSVTVHCTVAIQGPPARLTSIAIDTLLLTAKAAKGQTFAIFTLDDNADAGSVPEYERVMPERTADDTQGPRINGFNGQYLARIGTVQKALGASKARIQMGEGSHAPMRADIETSEASAVIVIMPRLR